MADLPYLRGYPESVLQQVAQTLASGALGRYLAERYPARPHPIQSDKALYDYVQAIRQQYLKNAPPLNKVMFDSRIQILKNALGLNTAISRVQGNRLAAKSEIRIASLFRQAPEVFLRMIVVHELAHLKEREHNKAFYQLCRHMEPDYPQLEFDLRLYLTVQEAMPLPV